MEFISTITNSNRINRKQFLLGILFLNIIFLLVSYGISIVIGVGWNLPGFINAILAIMWMKITYMFIIKRFHDFDKLGKKWAYAYFGLLLIITFVWPMFPDIMYYFMRRESLLIGILFMITFLPLIIIWSISGSKEQNHFGNPS